MVFRKMGITAALALFVVLPALNGCSHLPYQSAANISGHSMSVQKNALKVAGRVDSTMAAMDALINKPSGSLGTDYKAFCDKLSTLKSGYSDLKDAISNVSSGQSKYMAAWEKQIQSIDSPDIQAVAKSNYSNAKEDFSRFTSRAATTESSGSKLIAYLNNMRKYLATDLSASGIHGASGLLGKAKSRAANFKHNLGRLGKDATRLSNDLKPTAGTGN
ncbi:MAG: DUF2959 family protein [Phycisphaerae bacterium]